MKIKNNIHGLIVVGVVAVILHARAAQAATFSLSPSAGSYTVGQSIVITLRENSAGQAINAGEGTVSWSPTTLQFVSVSSNGSIFKYWPVDPAVRGSSSLVFSGGLPSPGYNGTGGTVLRMTFTAKAAGLASVSISNARILANDGQGTDIYTGQVGATYTITGGKSTPPPTTEVPTRPTPVVSSSNFSDPTLWYRQPEAQLSWTKPSGLQGVSYSLTADPGTTPDDVLEPLSTSKTITLTADGVWYFHLRGKYESGWSSTTHYALRLDRQPPEPFTPAIVQDRGLTDPTPILNFSTTDTLSGIAKYVYSLDGGPGVDASSPTDLAGVAAGTHTLIVTAVDQAGNSRQGEPVTLNIEGYPAPTITFVSTPLVLLDPLIVRGLANVGDTMTIYANNQIIGQAVAGPSDATAAPGVTLRVPWSFSTDKLFRPGTFNVTATATSQDGQVSVATDPYAVRVNGRAITFNGRPIATLSVITPVIVLAILLLLAIAAVMTRLILALITMHRRQYAVEEELEDLRDVNRRQAINRQQLESALAKIEEDLEKGATSVRPRSRRRSKKRSR